MTITRIRSMRNATPFTSSAWVRHRHAMTARGAMIVWRQLKDVAAPRPPSDNARLVNLRSAGESRHTIRHNFGNSTFSVANPQAKLVDEATRDPVHGTNSGSLLSLQRKIGCLCSFCEDFPRFLGVVRQITIEIHKDTFPPGGRVFSIPIISPLFG